MKNQEPRGITRRTFLSTSLAAVPVLVAATGCQTAGGRIPAALAKDPARARLVVKNPARVRVLQLTDLHYFWAKDQTVDEKNAQINALVHSLVDRTKPDLIMVTGDLWPNNRNGAAESNMHTIIGWFEALGVPWAYAWGNHDELPDFSVGYDAFAKAKNSLYRGGASTDGNYVVDIVTPAQKRLFQLVCVNTKTKGVGKEQLAWLRKLAEEDPGPVPRFAFFHIPIRQYQTAWDTGTGFIGEPVSSANEDGSAFPILKQLSVKACFCGHDHVNDYSGVVEGMELVYGRATGGYGTERFAKGGKVIDIDGRKGTCQWLSVTADGKAWHPDKNMRVDDRATRK